MGSEPFWLKRNGRGQHEDVRSAGSHEVRQAKLRSQERASYIYAHHEVEASG